MANLRYFDETVYGNLFADIKNNIDFYTNSGGELKDLLPNIQYYGESTISANLSDLDFKNNMTTEEKNSLDIVNTRIIYDALNTLPPLVATNGYLWSYLCHTKYKEYIITRWIKNPEDEDKQEVKNEGFLKKNEMLIGLLTFGVGIISMLFAFLTKFKNK